MLFNKIHIIIPQVQGSSQPLGCSELEKPLRLLHSQAAVTQSGRCPSGFSMLRAAVYAA
jgi:hypothetical protein